MGVLLIIVGGFIGGFVLMGAFCILSKPVEKDVITSHCDEMIKIITAYKNGYKIEFRMLDGSDNDWYDVTCPSFNFGVASYRIKEEKKGKHINTRW